MELVSTSTLPCILRWGNTDVVIHFVAKLSIDTEAEARIEQSIILPSLNLPLEFESTDIIDVGDVISAK